MPHEPGHIVEKSPLDSYLDFLANKDQVDTVPGPASPAGDGSVKEMLFGEYTKDIKPQPVSDQPAVDFLGQLLWGGVSGLTWGASEFVEKSKQWEDMNDWEKTGWVTGEGLAILTPVIGPFALLGKAGSTVTKFAGNRYMKQAAHELVKDKRFLKEVAEEMGTRGLDGTSVVARERVAKEVAEKLGVDLTGSFRHKYTVGTVNALNTRQNLMAEKALFPQARDIIANVSDEMNLNLTTGAIKNMADNYISGLKAGTYVNDIGQWVTRGLAGTSPEGAGVISKYLGMAAQDFLYMGLHAAGQEKISSIVEGRDAEYSDRLVGSGIMALGFPLVRAIPGGGKESFQNGIRAYFQRFRKFSYKGLAEEGPQGEKAARGLLKVMSTGGHFNVINTSELGTSFWKAGGVEYQTGRKIVEAADDMPIKDVVTLLNKMRLATSRKMMDRFKNNYFGDLWESKLRLGTGILFMNEGVFRSGAFKDMSTQELSAHMFMAAFMTKSRGAWGHKEAQGYMHQEYGELMDGLRYLNVKKEGTIQDLLTMKATDDFMRTRGGPYALSETAPQVKEVFDKELTKDTRDWQKKPEESEAKTGDYPKVYNLLAVYNASRLIHDRNAPIIELGDISKRTLERLNSNINTIEFSDGKTVGEVSHPALLTRFSKETKLEIQKDYLDFFQTLPQEYGLSAEAIPGQKPLVRLITPPEGESYENVSKINDLLLSKGEKLGFEVISSTQDPVHLSDIAVKRNISIKEADAELGELTSGFLETLNKKYENYNFIWEIHKNPLLDALSKIDSITAKDDIFKTVMGIESENNNTVSLREQFLEMFTSSGRMNDSFYANVDHLRTDKKKGDVEYNEDMIDAFNVIEPFYEVFKRFNRVDVSSKNNVRKTQKFTKADFTQLSEKIQNMATGLSGNEKINFYETMRDAFNQRILSGGTEESFVAMSHMQEVGIGDVSIVQGLPKVSFETDLLVDTLFKDEADGGKVAGDIKKAIHQVKDIFPKQMRGEKHEGTFEDKENLLEYITIKDDIVNGKVKKFLNDVQPTIEALTERGAAQGQIHEIAELTQRMSDLIQDGKVVDGGQYREIYDSIKVIASTINKEKLLNKELFDRLQNIIEETDLRRDRFASGEFTSGKDTEIFSDIVNSYNKLIQEVANNDFHNKDKLMNLVIRLQNGFRGRSADLSYAQSKLYNELLEGKIKNQLKIAADDYVPLSELIKDFNQRGQWDTLGQIVEGVYKSINARNPEQGAYVDAASKMMESLEYEKIANHQPATVQQMLQTYPSLRNPLDKNKVNDQFPIDITNAVESTDPGKTVEQVFEKWIYGHIRRKEKNPERAEELIEKFQWEEAAPLLQSMFSRKERSVMTFDHGSIDVSKEKVRESLSTTVLDRRGREGNAYDYNILKGKIKIGNRSVEMDSDYELGGNWVMMQRWIDKSNITNSEEIENFHRSAGRIKNDFSIDDVDELRAEMDRGRADGESTGQTDSPLVYMRLSPALRILFHRSDTNIRKLEDDFKQEYQERRDAYEGNDGLLNQLETGFKWLYNTTSTSNEILRTKMMFVQMNRVMSSEFDKLLVTKMNKGDEGKIEYNAFKRGFLADGGTTSVITKEAVQWMSTHHPDEEVNRFAANRIEDPFIRTLVIDDEANRPREEPDHFFSIKKLILRKSQDKVTATAGRDIENGILAEFQKSLEGEEYPSINESFFNDGGKITDAGLGKFLHALKGRPSNKSWNGIKTIIQDKNLLGKGFTIEIPAMNEMMDRAGVHMIIGKTVAKTLDKSIQPFVFDKTRNLEDKWWNQIRDVARSGDRTILDKGIYNLPLEALSVSFTSHEEPGVHFSNSQLDFQNTTHLNAAKKLYRIDKIIKDLKEVTANANLSNGSLLRALYDIRERETGLQLTSDTYSLSEQLLDYGMREGNFLLQQSVKQLLQSEYYRLLTKRPTKHGEEGFLAVDYKNELEIPVYAKFRNKMELDNLDELFEGTAGAHNYATNHTESSWNSVYQFGEGTITNKMARAALDDPLTKITGINDLPFVYRDKNGVDVVFHMKNGKEILNHSSFYESLDKGSSFADGQDGISIKGIEGKGNSLKDKFKEGREYKYVEKAITNLHGKIVAIESTLGRKATYDDVMRLLEGKHIGKKKQGLKLKASDIRTFTEGKTALGMSVNAIPKVLKDQPLLRVKRSLEKKLNGLSTVNAFDLRVTLQRDYDGDHFYKYMRLPMGMLKNYMNDMGDIPDYPMYKDKTYEQADGVTPNMFGFGANGEAGRDINTIGMDKMAHHVAAEKRNVATVISLKGTLSHIANAGVLIDGIPLVGKEAFLKNNDLPENISRAFIDTGILNQNALDIWHGKAAAFNVPDALKEFYLYRILPDGESYEGDFAGTESSSFMKDGFGKSSYEREIFDIMHRTLKKTKLVENQVHDNAGKRQPTQDELIRAKNNIDRFFNDPNKFILEEMLHQIKMHRRNGRRQIADKLFQDTLKYFFEPQRDKDKGFSIIIDEMSKGILSTQAEARAENKITIADKSQKLKATMSGWTLDMMLRGNNVFYDPSAGKFYDNRIMKSNKHKSAVERLTDMDNAISRIYFDGEKSVDQIIDVLDSDSVFASTRWSENDTKSVSMKKANERGILLYLTNNDYYKSLSYYRALEREPFPDQNKLDRALDRVDTLETKLEFLNRQMNEHTVRNKDAELITYFTPRTKDSDYNFLRKEMPKEGILYEITTDLGKVQDIKDNYKHMKYYKTVKEGQYVNMTKGKTYVLDKNPVKLVLNSDEEVRWHRAYEKATGVGVLTSSNLIDYQERPIDYARFVEEARNLRNNLHTIDYDVRAAVKESMYNKKDKYQFSGEEINQELDNFFSKWSGQVDGGFEALFRYILQPTMQRNVYVKDGLYEAPYYKPDTYFTNKVLNWLANWNKADDLGTTFDRYNVDREQVLRDFVSDNNAIHDNRLDDVEYKARQYMRNRLSGNEEWEKFYRTTKHALLDHWFYHPVLSEYMKGLYGNFPGITRKKDKGRMQYLITPKGVESNNQYIYDTFKGCY